MAAKIVLSPESLRERLRRLSVVFSVELRLKIVTELYMRPMGAPQFFREFGGGSRSRVAKNFQRLAEEGWLRYVGTAPAVSGRGTEKLYRAPELAFFDAATWAQVPYSLRVASSWNIFNQIAPRLRDAIGAPDLADHLGLTRVLLWLDERGWERIIKALNQHFVMLYEHQHDAQLRAMQSGAHLLRADVFLIGFEVPQTEVGREGLGLPVVHRESLMPFHERLGRALADEVSFQIISELNERDMTVLRFYLEFHQKFDGVSLRAVTRRFEALEKIKWLAKIGQRINRRSKREPIYRATVPVIDDRFPKSQLRETPDRVEQWEDFERLCDEARDSMRAGLFDRRTDRYVAWFLLNLDRRAFEQVVAELAALRQFLENEQERASKRLTRSGEEPIVMSVNLAAFQSLEELAKAP